MFNDLNAQKTGRPAVDDIFAETDKAPEGLAANTEIETRRVGLTATDNLVEETPEQKRSNKWLTIVLIVVGAAILILGGYLIYSKFFKAASDVNQNLDTNNLNKKATNTKVVDNPPTGGVSVPIQPTTPTPTTTAVTIPDIPGVNVPITTTTVITTVVATSSEPTLDTDNDGLTDYEETNTHHTNPNVVDTDHDGLSDYEEVKIYKTNPLNSDTDGDGYLDGAEVKSGYNPNGPGKLPGNK